MGDLQRFLEESHDQLQKWKTMDEIHIVLGNEAGDLDSVMSTITYAYFLWSVTTVGSDKKMAFLPVLNFNREDMDIRFEHLHLFRKVKINPDQLIYRSQLNLEEMVEFQETKKSLHTYLVDHHQLAEKDKILKNTVCRIFDHRPLDNYYSWRDQNLIMRLEGVASCSTLIADEIFKENENIWNKDLAYLMLCTIIYDMKGFDNQGSPDEEIKRKLRVKSQCNMDSKKIYRLLEDLHSKIDGLTPLQILKRDLKFQNGILFPRLSMSARNFIKLKDAYAAVETLCLQYKSQLAVLICGIKKLKGSTCDVGVFFLDSDDVQYMNKFVSKLNEAHLTDVKSNYRNFIVFEFSQNRKLGRKKMLPLVLKIHDSIGRNESES